MAERQVANRWIIAAAGVMMQLALGAVYAWSVFKNPLVNEFGWSTSEVTWTFTITIFTLGITAFFGGLWMNKQGPRIVGIAAGVLYGLGVFLASVIGDDLWGLYLTYGVLGGIGIGLGYIVPVAVLVKWFPDRCGFITGVAVAGFGAGALITAPLATRLIDAVGVLTTFAILGIAYFIMVVGAALFMKNPPPDYRPAGWQPSEAQLAQRAKADYTLGAALSSWQWYGLWAMLFLNVTAGIAIISQAAPMAQDLTGVDELLAATMVSIISIGNGVGRFLWAWLSDFIGRKWVFLSTHLLQAAIFVILPQINIFWLFTALAFIVLLCYGGGFGTMPAFTADYFGPKNVGQVYGLMITAWGFAGVLGPLLIAYIYESTQDYATALYIIAGILLVASVLPFIVRPPGAQTDEQAVRAPRIARAGAEGGPRRGEPA